MIKNCLSKILFLLFVAIFLPQNIFAAIGTIDATDKYSIVLEDGSQINWNTTEGEAVSISDTAITGEIWGENIGWIVLDPTEGGVLNDGVRLCLGGKCWLDKFQPD